ncbi:hypothetical protein [Streptococcus bovimastitidis]|uniref:hypothetical protein n=1 Tax=Streptococcus bovimastitidis TaxID=1856638 RepID=UPI0013F4C834|nr:hypothetical protein [Streptococcus bovimastitidis]
MQKFLVTHKIHAGAKLANGEVVKTDIVISDKEFMDNPPCITNKTVNLIFNDLSRRFVS